MAFRPHRFGRYIIVDPIAVGGMAEIYRARLAASKEGPDRIIVIKKVIANLSQNSEFLQMFEEEIKITVGLTHPNIIQIYDYGKVDEQYFMAMEYVEGKNLRQFVKRLADMKSMFSIDMSCYIISQVCHALSHAHSYKDRLTGKPLGIVHRDISPQNVMISYDGAVKLFDFGIAKAKSASEATRAGVIKGKPSYLSPEQINGEELDGRSDIFALGIVLWELLTAKRLFVAETDMGVLRLIQSAKIEPPSTFNPAVPQALDAIVLKSLTRDKNKRYQGAEEFQRDLHKFLYSFNPSFNPADLSYYAQELFKTEIRDDRDRLSKYLDMPPIDEGGGQEAPIGGGGNKAKLSNKMADGLISTTDFNREMMDQVAQNTGSMSRPSDIQLVSSAQIQRPKNSALPTATSVAPKSVSMPGAIPNSVGAGGAGTQQSKSSSLPPPPNARRAGNDSMVIPPWSKAGSGSGGVPRPGTRTSNALRKEMDSHGGGNGKTIAVLMLILVVGGGYFAGTKGYLKSVPFVADLFGPVEPKDPKPTNTCTPPNCPTVKEPVRGVASKGKLTIHANESLFWVYVNGQAVKLDSTNTMDLDLNKNFTVEVRALCAEPQSAQIMLAPENPAQVKKFNLNPLPGSATGTLTITAVPDGDVTLFKDGAEFASFRSPKRDMCLPAGKYQLKASEAFIGVHAESEVTIEAGKLKTMSLTLTK